MRCCYKSPCKQNPSVPLATGRCSQPACINSPSPCVQHVGVADAQDAAAIPQVCEAQPAVGVQALRHAKACHSLASKAHSSAFVHWAATVLADLLHLQQEGLQETNEVTEWQCGLVQKYD